MLTSILGGAYSSTVTTVVLAKRSAAEHRPHVISGATLMTSGMMYLRISTLLGLFNRDLMSALAASFAPLSAGALVFRWLVVQAPRLQHSGDQARISTSESAGIEIRVFLSALFLMMLIATHAAATYLGKLGVYTLAVIMGVANPDPFILGITQSAGSIALSNFLSLRPTKIASIHLHLTIWLFPFHLHSAAGMNSTVFAGI